MSSLKKYHPWLIGTITLVVLYVGYFYFFQFRAPGNFPENTVIEIHDGKSLAEITNDLEKQHIIRSPFWFNNFVIMLKREKRIVGGVYYFDHKMSVLEIAKRLTRGTYNVEQIRTTVPEGTSAVDIGISLKKRYPEFDQATFVALAKKHEGYLFPDTYLFGANPQPESVVEIMTATFDKKIAAKNIQDALMQSGKKLEDVVKMASILEGEARQMKTRRIVAGILWERLRLGIPLQVDATFRYINGKTTEELTMSDLKIDSPYNTYVYKGLPPTPISNPGIDSILAAVTPIETEYLYFLTDKDGNMHYAETLDEHAANKRRYLSQ